MSLDQVIRFAQAQSRSVVQARSRFRASYWQFRTQRAAFLPTLSLSATAPDLTIAPLPLMWFAGMYADGGGNWGTAIGGARYKFPTDE